MFAALKFGIPALLLLGILGYIGYLKISNANLQAANTQLSVDKQKAVDAQEEQRQENIILRQDVLLASAGKQHADEALSDVQEKYDTQLKTLLATRKDIENEALANAYVSGNRANAWFNDWMQRVWELRAEGNSRGNQNGEGIHSAGVTETVPAAPNRVVLQTINSAYAERMQENCDNSKWDNEGMVDESLPGDPTYCNWYVVAIPGDRYIEFRLYLEQTYRFMVEQDIWGQYYKDATHRFKDIKK